MIGLALAVMLNSSGALEDLSYRMAFAAKLLSSVSAGQGPEAFLVKTSMGHGRVNVSILHSDVPHAVLGHGSYSVHDRMDIRTLGSTSKFGIAAVAFKKLSRGYFADELHQLDLMKVRFEHFPEEFLDVYPWNYTRWAVLIDAQTDILPFSVCVLLNEQLKVNDISFGY